MSRVGHIKVRDEDTRRISDDRPGDRRYGVGRFGARVGTRSSRARSLPRVSLVPRGFLGPRLGL
jgi:hypothetical protein